MTCYYCGKNIYIIKVKKYKEGNNEIKIKTGTTVLANG